MQKIKHISLDEYVFSNFERLYARLEEGKKLIPANQFHELHYEDLVRDPEEQLKLLYDNLQLEGFDQLQPARDYLQKTAGYERNRYNQDPEKQHHITSRLSEVIRRYGYER